MDKENVDLLIQKNPHMETSREKLESMSPGAYCLHRSWGVGQIKSYDEQLNKLIVDFEENKSGHLMDPIFCVDKLDILPPENILVRQRKEPKIIEEMIKKRQTDLIVEILAVCPKHSATNTELEHQLNLLLGPTRYKKWWYATRKLLIKDPRVAIPEKKVDPYILRDEPIKAEDEILDEFLITKAPKKKIALADKLLSLSVKHEDIKEALPDILKTLTVAIQETRQLNAGERLHGIWVRNDLARFIHEDVETLLPTSASIIEDKKLLTTLANEIPSTCHRRFLELVVRCHPEGWEKLLLDLFRNSSGKFTNECVNLLLEKDCEKIFKESLQHWLNEQTIKGPILLWIIKNRHSKKFSKMLKKLICPRFLNSIFYAIDNTALQSSSLRRIPLADVLGDDKTLIPELLADATSETVHDLATTLMLNQGFEDLSKRSLLARFIKLFPSVQSLVSEEPTTKQEVLVVSRESFEKRKLEYDEIATKKIPENKIALGLALELGDLRENSELKMARQDQDTLLARKELLEIDLSRAQINDFKSATSDRVGVGTIVELLQGSTNISVTYSILGAWDSDPDKNILSYETPLGQSLISKKVGDLVIVEIDGHEEEWTIQGISRWVDRVKK